jgi:transposase
MQYRTIVISRVPRVQCPTHGVRQVRVAWAEDRSRFTALFEALAIRFLKEMSLSGMAELMQLSWDEAAGIFRRAVARGLARRKQELIRFYGVDETSFQKRHEYVTVVADLERNCVRWVGEARREESLGIYWQSLTEEEHSAIQEVVMDMWDPYIAATRDCLPDGQSKITFDRYHVMLHVNAAVDRVRKDEHARLRKEGDERLKGTKYIWLKGEARRSARDNWLIAQLSKAGLKVGRAWALKEAIRKLWLYRSDGWARRFFKKWYGWAVRSRLPAMVQAAKMIRYYLYGVLGYLRFRHTNALTESLNSKIQELKYRARGYRNRENFKLAILFHCGGLSMDPL